MAQEATSGQVLLVGGDPDTRQWLEELLSDVGYHVRAVAEARTARRLLAQEPFELAMVDVRLPDRSGVDLLAHLRASSSTPCIGLSEAIHLDGPQQKGEDLEALAVQLARVLSRVRQRTR